MSVIQSALQEFREQNKINGAIITTYIKVKKILKLQYIVLKRILMFEKNKINFTDYVKNKVSLYVVPMGHRL